MPSRHHLRCLGEPALIAPTGRPVEFRTRKALGLLVFLAVEPRPHVREGLAEMLWSRAGVSESRHSLANAISEIRRRLGRPAVETSGDRVRLRPDIVELDLQRLMEGDILGDDVEPPLDVDGFLEGFDLPDAVGFAHWKESRRAALIPFIRDALAVLIDRARRTGDFPGLGRLGDRLARFDELSEDAMRARMESRAFAGDRLGALRLFEQWKVELAGQLGAAPSDLLEGMAMRLRRRGWERPGAAEAPAVRTESWRDRPFVGRGREYRQLYESWEATLRGAPSHRLVLGDSGVGKSTLVERFAAVAALEGATVVRTQCHELERELPYAAATELIKQLVDRPGASATPPEQLAELAQHIPAVGKRFEGLPEPVAMLGEASKVRFSEATHALLVSVAEEHPLIVIIDDVHNCDDVSLAVLHHALRRIERHPLMFLLVARTGEIKRSPNGAKILEQANALGLAPLDLPPLSSEETGALLEHLLREGGDEVGILGRRALVAASSGFPLVLELLVRDWRISGPSSIAFQLDAVTPSIGTPPQARETYRLVLDRLFGTLEGDARTVLHAAAVLGQHLNDPGMYALADLSASQMMHGLGRLTELRLLRDGGNGLEFANDVVRAHVYMSVPPSMRKLLHGRVADELIRRAALGDTGYGLDIAWHCMRSGRAEEAMDFLVDGAQRAIGRGAVHEAEFRLTSALEQFEGDKRSDAVLVLCELLQEQARWPESLDVLKTSSEALASKSGQARRFTAMAAWGQLTASELSEAAELVSVLASDDAIDGSTARAAALLATRIHSSTYDVALTERVRDAVATLEARKWTDEDRIDIALARIKLDFGLGMDRQARERALGMLEQMAKQTKARTLASARSYGLVSGIALLKATLGRLEEAVREQEHALSIASRLDNQNLIANCHANSAEHHGWLGNHLQQLQSAERALQSPLLRHSTPYSAIKAAYNFAYASTQLGKPEGVARAVEMIQDHGMLRSPTLTQFWLFCESDFHHFIGDDRTALSRSIDAIKTGDGRCLNARLTAGLAARGAMRVLRAGADRDDQALSILQALSALIDTMELPEQVEALAAVLCVQTNGHERTKSEERLHAALRLMPLNAARKLEVLGTPAPERQRDWTGY